MISMDKQYRTAEGNEVRLYATDSGGKFPVHGACLQADGTWGPRAWLRDGRHSDVHPTPDARDLIEVKPKITRTYWLVHPKQANQSVVFSDHKEALRYAQGFTSGYSSLTGPHTVEFEEGSGL